MQIGVLASRAILAWPAKSSARVGSSIQYNRTEVLPTPSCPANSLTVGNRSPARYLPSLIKASTRSDTASARGSLRIGSTLRELLSSEYPVRPTFGCQVRSASIQSKSRAVDMPPDWYDNVVRLVSKVGAPG